MAIVYTNDTGTVRAILKHPSPGYERKMQHDDPEIIAFINTPALVQLDAEYVMAKLIEKGVLIKADRP